MSGTPASPTPSDHDLVEWAAKGNQEAFGELTRRYRPSVLSAIQHLVRDPDLAEDLTQDAFIKAQDALGTFRENSRFSPWILKIANNAALDHLKRDRRLKRKGLDTVPLEPTPNDSRPQKRPAGTIVRALSDSTPTRPDPKEARRVMEEAIAKLRGHYRRCMYLREIEGLSYEHIAQMLGLTKGTVSSYVTRGRKLLRDMPGPHQDVFRPH